MTAQRLACGQDFIQLSGNDETALAFNAMGGVGCISVTANVAPRLCAEFQKATREERWDDALTLQDRLYPLHVALFSDASPAPIKYGLSRVRPGFPTDFVFRWWKLRTRQNALTMHWSMQALSKRHRHSAPVRQAKGRGRKPPRAL